MNRLLFIGCVPGMDVASVQADLNQVQSAPGQVSVYSMLVADGIFGAKTHQRVQEFQRLNRLTADGVVGPNTQQKLQTLLGMLPGQPQHVAGGISSGVNQGESVVKPVPAFHSPFGGATKSVPQDKNIPGRFGSSPKGGARSPGAVIK